MPTENRSSNTEMVSVQTKDLLTLVEHAEDELEHNGTDLQQVVNRVRGALTRSSDQHLAQPKAALQIITSWVVDGKNGPREVAELDGVKDLIKRYEKADGQLDVILASCPERCRVEGSVAGTAQNYIGELEQERDTLLADLREMAEAPLFSKGINVWRWFRWDGVHRPINKRHVCDVALKDGRILFEQSPHDFDWSGDEVIAARHGGIQPDYVDKENSGEPIRHTVSAEIFTRVDAEGEQCFGAASADQVALCEVEDFSKNLIGEYRFGDAGYSHGYPCEVVEIPAKLEPKSSAPQDFTYLAIESWTEAYRVRRALQLLLETCQHLGMNEKIAGFREAKNALKILAENEPRVREDIALFERTEFERFAENLSFRAYQLEWLPDQELYGSQKANIAWQAWKARAALERKP